MPIPPFPQFISAPTAISFNPTGYQTLVADTLGNVGTDADGTPLVIGDLADNIAAFEADLPNMEADLGAIPDPTQTPDPTDVAGIPAQLEALTADVNDFVTSTGIPAAEPSGNSPTMPTGPPAQDPETAAKCNVAQSKQIFKFETYPPGYIAGGEPACSLETPVGPVAVGSLPIVMTFDTPEFNTLSHEFGYSYTIAFGDGDLWEFQPTNYNDGSVDVTRTGYANYNVTFTPLCVGSFGFTVIIQYFNALTFYHCFLATVTAI